MPRRARAMVQFNLRLPAELYEWLRAEAERQGTDMTAVLLALIHREAWLDKHVKEGGER